MDFLEIGGLNVRKKQMFLHPKFLKIKCNKKGHLVEEE